ncbi:MAG: hypothetical protein ABIX46_03445 [Burkholderiaceae bacterium]
MQRAGRAGRQAGHGRLPTCPTSRSRPPRSSPARIRRALPYVAKERVTLAPDCGMKYLPREIAQGKLRAMVAAALMLRAEHAG